jgi:hypothetical protein
MFIASLIILGVVLAIGVTLLLAAHIPGLREITGAAPLQHDDKEGKA